MNRPKKKTDHQALIKAMQECIQSGALLDKWKSANKIHALHIHYGDPAPDGDFEIVFVTDKERESRKKLFAHHGNIVDEISFENGVALAKEEKCCGGDYALNELSEIFAINPALKPDGFDL